MRFLPTMVHGVLDYLGLLVVLLPFILGLAQMLAKKGNRVNAVAPGPIWTPVIPSTMPQEKAKAFGEKMPLARAGQPAELAGAYVLFASGLGRYMTGPVIPVTGGSIMI